MGIHVFDCYCFTFTPCFSWCRARGVSSYVLSSGLFITPLFEVCPAHVIVRDPKTGIEFDNLLVLFNRRIEVVLEQVRKSGIGAYSWREWIKLLRSFDLTHRFIKSQSGSEIKSKPLMGRRVVRV